jgi:hypothetical protein
MTNLYKFGPQSKLNRPIAAFVTFETEEGYMRAINSKDMKVFDFEEKVEFLKAPEPSDIIWENLDEAEDGSGQSWAKWKVFLTLMFCLLVSFLIIFYGTKWQLKVTSKFPPTTQCDKIYEKYGDELEVFAYNDWVFNDQR